LLETVERQTFRDYEVLMIKGVTPQGRAINQGASAAKGEILLILDDDSWLADNTVFQRLIETLDSDPTIGMAGASIVPPPSASQFQHRAGAQFPRFNTPVVDITTDSDLACHGCCAIPKTAFDKIGGEREDILRGLDPDLRVRLRAAGYRIVLAPNTRIHHPLPEGWRSLSRTFFRNGFGSAYARKFQPETVYETHESLNDATFQPKTSFTYRLARFPLRLIRALAHGEWIRFWAYCAYACGYAWGMLTAREQILAGGTSNQTRH
jgi:GT2 family glycosyltransferase